MGSPIPSPAPDVTVRSRANALSDRVLLGFIFVTALALRLGAVAALHNFSRVTGFESESLARNMLAGRGFSLEVFGPLAPTAHQYPLYAFFLAACQVSFPVVESVQAVVGAASCLLLFVLGRQLIDRDTGLWAAALMAVYPIYVYWTVQIQPLVLEIFLLLAATVLIRRAIATGRARDCLTAGIVFGIGCLAKSLYLGFLAPFALWAYLLDRRVGAIARGGVLLLAAAAVVIAPWTLRNYRVFHTFILINNNSGLNLWVGNNPHASGSVFTHDGRSIRDTLPPEDLAYLASIPEAGRDAWFRRTALDYISAHPWEALARVPAKLAALWWFDEQVPTDFPWARKAAYLAVLLPACAGMWLARRRWREMSVFYGMFAAITVAYSIFYGGARFRYILEWALLLFAAVTARRCASALTRRRTPSPAAGPATG